VAKYSYCYGIVKDDAYMEHECERRDDCVFYHIDNMRRFWNDADYEMFFPPVGDCPFVVQREKEISKQEFVSFFE
jgi:hypothetical protein